MRKLTVVGESDEVERLGRERQARAVNGVGGWRGRSHDWGPKGPLYIDLVGDPDSCRKSATRIGITRILAL